MYHFLCRSSENAVQTRQHGLSCLVEEIHNRASDNSQKQVKLICFLYIYTFFLKCFLWCVWCDTWSVFVYILFLKVFFMMCLMFVGFHFFGYLIRARGAFLTPSPAHWTHSFIIEIIIWYAWKSTDIWARVCVLCLHLCVFETHLCVLCLHLCVFETHLCVHLF